ncbi:aldo/keto reductase [Frankia sp. AgB1.9]|nr:aldo/keto reductase [Frankia sp. AgW1.1]MBL7548310.1 aldo/keto reductase [Frankia sp. AgB1.9]MBL7625224.1 aldo/keto reductase [Frankia sp. AgB1.8]
MTGAETPVAVGTGTRSGAIHLPPSALTSPPTTPPANQQVALHVVTTRKGQHNELRRAAFVTHVHDERRPDTVGRYISLAAEVGLPLTHLAMALAIAHPGVTSAILGPRTIGHLDDLLAGLDVTLTDDILDRIDEIVPPGTDIGTLDQAYAPPPLQQASLRRRPVGEPAATDQPATDHEAHDPLRSSRLLGQLPQQLCRQQLQLGRVGWTSEPPQRELTFDVPIDREQRRGVILLATRRARDGHDELHGGGEPWRRRGETGRTHANRQLFSKTGIRVASALQLTLELCIEIFRSQAGQTARILWFLESLAGSGRVLRRQDGARRVRGRGILGTVGKGRSIVGGRYRKIGDSETVG